MRLGHVHVRCVICKRQPSPTVVALYAGTQATDERTAVIVWAKLTSACYHKIVEEFVALITWQGVEVATEFVSVGV